MRPALGRRKHLRRLRPQSLLWTPSWGEIEDAHAKARGEAAKGKALRLRDMALVFGLASLATLGAAAVCVTIGAPDPITQASAVIGTSLSLGWALKIAWK